MKALCITFLLLFSSLLSPHPLSFPVEPIYRAQFDLEITVLPDAPNFTDITLLADLLFAECRNQSFNGKLGVANVVMNRISLFQKSLKEVIFEKGQFDGIHAKAFRSDSLKAQYQKQYDECKRAAYLALIGRKILPISVIFYHNKKIATDTKWVKRLEKREFITIQDHTFCHSLTYKDIL